MTKKESFIRAQKDYARLVDLTIGTKFADLEKVLTENNIQCYKVGCFTYAKTDYAEFGFTEKEKGYATINTSEIEVGNKYLGSLGIYSYNEILKNCGIVHHYLVKLTDTCSEESFVYEVETYHTLKQFETEYSKARNYWYKHGNNPIGCLIEYITERLAKKGFYLANVNMELELDF